MKEYILFKRGKYWYYRLAGKKTFISCKSLHPDKKNVTNKYLADRLVIEYIEKGKLDKVTLKEYTQNFFVWEECKWIKRQHAKDRSFSKSMASVRRAHLKNHILPRFGEEYMDKLQASYIEDWFIELPISNQTKNHIFYTFNIVMREAKRDRTISVNPLDMIEPFKINFKKRDILSASELKKLFPSDNNQMLGLWQEWYWSAFFYLLLTSGIRSGEARALLWGDIDWDTSALLLTKAVKADKSIGSTKSRETRAVFLPDRTLDLLNIWRDHTPYPNSKHLIFYGNSEKNPIYRRITNKKFEQALERAGVNKEGRNIVVHSLRHTYNTVMRKVLPEAMLRFQLGHKNQKMTERYDGSKPLERLKQFLPERQLIKKAWI